MLERELTPDPAPPADPLLADAVDRARSAAVEVGGSDVGEHLGCRGEAHEVGMGQAATHLFHSTLPGYVGWCWAVTLARPEHRHEADDVTVDEVVLVAGKDAVLAPEWVPWAQRVSAEDLGPGDMLVTELDDDRLVPGYTLSGDPAVDEVAWELGFGRQRVLSRVGRLEAADRWHGGDHGPRTAMARHAPAACGTCGFFLPLSGSLRAGFGACGNLFSPADGHVVAVDFGCGAHSEAAVPADPDAPGRLSYDTQEYDEITDEMAEPVETVEIEAAVDATVEVELEPAAEGQPSAPTTEAEPATEDAAQAEPESAAAAPAEAEAVPTAAGAEAAAEPAVAEAEPVVAEAEPAVAETEPVTEAATETEPADEGPADGAASEVDADPSAPGDQPA